MGYRPPHRYTEEELRVALLADLENDLAFSIRTDPDAEEWVTYRAKLRADIANLKTGGPDPRLEPVR